MKKILMLSVLMGIFVVLTASFASALTVQDINIGNSRQDRVKGVTASLIITNTDQANTLAVNSITHTADNSKFNIREINPAPPFTVDAGQQKTVAFKLDIPLDFDAVDPTTLSERAFKIGDFTVSGTVAGGNISDTAEINVQAANQLGIKDINIECNGITESVDDGDTVDNLRPSMDCSVEVEVENNFRESDISNQRIGDVEFESVDIEMLSDDDDVDFDDSDDIDGLDAGDEDTVTLDGEIEEDAKDGKVSVDIRVSGFDENGAFHGEDITFKLEIDREKHDLLFRSFSISPNLISACTGGNVRINAVVQNLGQRDERKALVKASIDSLGVGDETTEMGIDEDSSRSVTLNLAIAAGTESGVYTVLLESFYELTAFSNAESLDLVVERCAEEEEDMEEEEEEVITITPTTPTTPVETCAETAPIAAPRTRVRSTFRDTGAYIGLLIGLGILLLVVITVLIAIFAKRKPRV